MVVLCAGQSMKAFILGQLDTFGTDYIQVEPKAPNTAKDSSASATAVAQGVALTAIKNNDYEAVIKLPNLGAAYAAVTGQAIAKANGEKKTTMLYGLTSQYPEVDAGTLWSGRFFTDEEDKSLARVAVLGWGIKEKFFPDQDPVGQMIKIGQYNFRIIGVYAERGSAFFFNLDDLIVLPLETTQKLIMGIDHITFLVAKMTDPSRAGETVDEVVRLLRERHDLDTGNPDKDDFAVHTAAEAQDLLTTIVGGVTLLLIALAAISLIVGGVGIMNIMYVTVTERTAEIGLRKAVGATQRDILWQFLAEAVAVTLLGGIVGVILGLLVTGVVSVGAASQGYNFPFIISWSGIALAVGFSVGVGIIFGYYPAKRAAGLDPIEALRWE
ncbi:MAG: ABC transporter permease [Patescibacteria group bacterium]